MTASPSTFQSPRLGVKANINVYSHGVRVEPLDVDATQASIRFCRTVAQWGLVKAGPRQFRRGMIKIFAGAASDRRFFHFHRHQYQALLDMFSKVGINTSSLNITHVPLYTPAPAAFRYHDPRTPRDYQAPIIDYVVDEGHTKVVTLNPGEGKTFIALKAIHRLGVRTFFCIQPKYMKKWIIDAKEAFDLRKGDIIKVQGSKELQQVIELAKEDQLDAQIIICSNKTFQMYLKAYEKASGDLHQIGYGCAPIDFYKTLKIGFKVVDEVHESFHLNFRQDVYCHVPKTLSLSGTLESDDAFINKMNRIVFPPHLRYHRERKNAFTTCRALFYAINDVDQRVSYINPTLQMYSHVRFEQSVMKRKKLLNAYMDMVCDIFYEEFLQKRLDGQKCLIFFATVEMVNLFYEEMKRRYSAFDIARYVQGDEYEEMLEAEIVVSTLKSCGTAVDIPDLYVVILTDALGSRQANRQVMGRLRELKNYPGMSPQFLYLVCANIDKHVEYHHKKENIFAGEVIEHREEHTHYVL